MFCKRFIPKVTGPTIGIFNPFLGLVVTLFYPPLPVLVVVIYISQLVLAAPLLPPENQDYL